MVKDFIKECKRVFKVTRKPNKQEFSRVLKITGLGILVIGLVGFLVLSLYNMFF